MDIAAKRFLMLPLPFEKSAAVQLNLIFANGDELEVASTSIQVTQHGEPRFLEHFPCYEGQGSQSHGWGLTRRSTGAPTAGHQARSGGTRYIFASPGPASRRWRPVSSNVRQHNRALLRALGRGSLAQLPSSLCQAL
jgi:hypothetical protein